MILFASLWALTSHAGVGDPVDGSPSWMERDLHVWTNAARIAPHAFPKDAAEGGCSPTAWALTPPAHPLRYHPDLAQVARQHSADLASVDQGLSHESTDGTPMVERVMAAYGAGKPFGENLAYGYPTARGAVLSGWMCSDGHRHNLLDPKYDEVGHGVVGVYATQNLGGAGLAPHRINAASSFPEDPDGDVVLTTDVWHPDAIRPDAVEAVVDGVAVPLYLIVGREGQGVYQGLGDAAAGCVPWFVQARWGDEVVRWPETGSYAWGDCPFDDVEAQWLAVQIEAGDGPYDADPEPGDPGATDTDTEPEEVDRTPYTNLCATSPASASGVLVLVGLLGVRRRRRRISSW